MGGDPQSHPGRRAFREFVCHSFARLAYRFWIEGAPTRSLDRRSNALHWLTVRVRTGPRRTRGRGPSKPPRPARVSGVVCHSFARLAYRFWIEGAPTRSLDRRSNALHWLTVRVRTGPRRTRGRGPSKPPRPARVSGVSATHSRVSRTGFGSKAPLRAHLIVAPTHCIG